MGLPWLKLAVDVADHPKISVLEGELSLVEGLGLAVVIRLWCWAARFYPDGTIPATAYPAMASNALRGVMRTGGDNDSDNWRMIEIPEFVDALTLARLVERLDGACQLHDWDDFNSAHAKKAEQNRERQRRFRARRAALSTPDQGTDSTACDVTLFRNAANAPRVEKRKKETTPPFPPANSAGGDLGIGLVQESSTTDPPSLNGNAHEPELHRVEQPHLRRRSGRVETLAQAVKFDVEQVTDQRSKLLFAALEHRNMTQSEALAYANARWPTGPPNERVVALAFEAFLIRQGASPGGTTT